MDEPPMYHEQSRRLQDRLDTRRLADRPAEKLLRSGFNDEDRSFIENRRMFFLATTDADGFPDCSYKGGDPGFARVLDERTLVFPSYDGNGMFKRLGNILANPAVGLLFLDVEAPRRLRVTPRHVFPNCPRYVPKMQMVEASPYVPRAGSAAPVPDWKKRPQFNDVLPAGDPARDAGSDA